MAAPNAQPDSPQPDEVPEPAPDGAPEPTEPTGSGDSAGSDRSAEPERSPLDVDAQWAGIVAELSDLSDLDADGDAPDRGTSSGPPDAAGPDDTRRSAGEVLGSVPVAPWVRGPGPRDWPTTPEVEDLEEAESHFVPPDPPLVLGRDPLLTMAWAVVVAVPIVLLVVLVVARPYPVIVAQIGGGAFLAALAVLLWRMPHRRDDDEGGPGAVV